MGQIALTVFKDDSNFYPVTVSMNIDCVDLSIRGAEYLSSATMSQDGIVAGDKVSPSYAYAIRCLKITLFSNNLTLWVTDTEQQIASKCTVEKGCGCGR